MGHGVERAGSAVLREHVGRLTADGPRHRENPTAVLAALDYLTGRLAGYGYDVRQEWYGGAPHEVNLLAERPGAGDLVDAFGARRSDRPVLEIGAHWDSVLDGPGADDNASGVAGLLELARIFAADGYARRLRFCVFGGEEDQPVGCTGSRAHVARLDEEGSQVRGAIVLEMIAYRDIRPGSQRFPDSAASEFDGLGLPDRGDFIAAIGNVLAVDYLAAIHSAGRAQDPPLPVLPVSVPSGHTANGARSDHYPYWLSGRKGVMVTDTAEFRNGNYHRPTDTIETLDFEFAAQVTQTVADAVRVLLAEPSG